MTRYRRIGKFYKCIIRIFVNRLPSQKYHDVRCGKRDVRCGNRGYIQSSLGYRGRRKIKQHVFVNMT